MILSKFDGFEVHPLVLLGNGDNAPKNEAITAEGYEQCERDDPKLFCWGVYGHLIPDASRNIGGLESIADCATEAEAEALAELLEEHRKLAKLKETIADMASMIPPNGFEGNDSREVISTVISWAEEFERNFSEKENDQGLYLEKVETVFRDKWHAKYGFESPEAEWNACDAE